MSAKVRDIAFQSAQEVIDANVKLICQYFQGDEMRSAIEDLKETYLDFQTLQNDYNKSNDCLKKLKEIVAKDVNIISVNVEEEYGKLKAKADKNRYDKEKGSKDFDGKIKKCLDGKLDSEDILETQSIYTLIDPITKQTMKKPVKNIHCNHTYDLETITQMIKSKKGKGMKCPYQGCGNNQPLSVDDLIKDEVASRKLEQMLKSE